VVGEEQGTIGGFNHANLWRDGVAIDLNTLLDSSGTGWTLELATDMNDAGQIVGYETNSAGQQHAFMLTPIHHRGPKR